jgi:hypothetical protein
MQGFNGSLLAKLLRNYGITSHHTSVIRGYRIADFYDAWNRYIPRDAVTAVIESDASDTNDANPGVIQKNIQNLAPINQ